MPKKKIIPMEAKPLPFISVFEAEQAMIGAWRILDELREYAKNDQPFYIELHRLFHADTGVILLPIDPKFTQITLNQITWGVRSGIIIEEKLVFTLPKATQEWFAKHSAHWKDNSRSLKYEALQELFAGKAEVKVE